jgi:hypothetical protein
LLRLQPAAETWKDAQAFRSTSALVGAADHGSRTPACLFAAGFPVDELAMNFPPLRVDHGYLKVLVVTQALVAEMLGKYSAVLDCFNVGIELDSNPVSQRNAILHIEEKCLHRRHLVRSADRLAAENHRSKAAI